MTEKLSALVDNELEELERAQVLRDLSRDEALSERWSHYHIIGRAMRQEVIVPSRSLVERVAAQLAREGGTSPALRSVGRSGPLYGSAGRYAVAASVVAVLLLGGLSLKLYDNSREVQPTPAGVERIAGLDDATHWDNPDPQVDDALNALLVEHGEFTPASGMNGLTAYTKFVSYDSR
jgi:sigma-E factor negative regulatory protein RseA